jgi:hypothetical protein
VELFLNLTATGFVLVAISSNNDCALKSAEPVVLSVGTPYLTFAGSGIIREPDNSFPGPYNVVDLTIELDGRFGKVFAEYNVLSCEPEVKNCACVVPVSLKNKFRQ